MTIAAILDGLNITLEFQSCLSHQYKKKQTKGAVNVLPPWPASETKQSNTQLTSHQHCGGSEEG